MANKTCKRAFRYLMVFVILESSVAGLLPDTLAKWIESDDNGHWLLNKRSTSSSLHSYWIRIKEGQSVVDENIVIDTSKKIEQFHVLPYDSVDEAIILSDFNKNWTIIKLPKKNQCFLQKLKPVTPPPKVLNTNIKKAIATNGTNSTVNIDIAEKSTWKVNSVLYNRLLLTAEMKKLCSTAPIYEISRSAGMVYINGLKRQGRSSSNSKYPRSACGGVVCSYYYRWYLTLNQSGQLVWVKLKVKDCQTISC